MNEAQAAAAPAKSTADDPWPVRVVSQKIGAWIGKLGWVWVDGQVAQISRRPRGITFLTLRDPAANLSLTVTVHQDVLEAGAPDLAEGARVTMHAKPEFYPARGSLSLRADEVRQVGLGELLVRLERLRQLLRAEGLFDPRRKRPLPFLPTRIGLITGQKTAAERDVLENAWRRWPGAEFRVLHAAVQGPSAVPQVLGALKALDDDETVDVIVIARGGGSVEDLLPFSDEALCRAVFAARTPVVSAIGHDVDRPLLDDVADFRASTPTDAAKQIVPDLADEIDMVAEARYRLNRAMAGLLDRERQRIEALRSRPVLARPETLIDQRFAEVTALRDRAGRSLEHRVRRADDELRHTVARLRALSPLATLQRGYAIVQRDDGHVVRASGEVAEGDQVRVRVAEGALTAVVSGVSGEGE